jgi:hypothetical protein
MTTPSNPCDCCAATTASACTCAYSYCFASIQTPPGLGIWCGKHCPCRDCRLGRGDRATERMG